MSQELHAIFAENVKDLMSERGWTQVELAAKLHVTQGYVSQIIRGESRPGLDSLAKFAKVFKVEPSDLLKKRSRETVKS